jgi:hypothetical protein
MLSIDYTDGTGNHTLEDEQLHFYYVDTDDTYDQERTTSNWPWGAGCSNPLPIDGSAQGEMSCWIIRTGCYLLNWESARVRVKDDCNNWTRSEELAVQGDLILTIDSPADESEQPFGTPVTFEAGFSGSTLYDGLEQYIK